MWRTHALTIERIAIPDGTCLQGHGHDTPHLCFLETGSFWERHAGRNQEVVHGMLRSSPAGDTHDIVFRSPSRCFLILFHGDLATSTSHALNERRFIVSTHVDKLVRGLLHGMLAERIVSPLSMEAAVLELVAATLPGRGRRRGEPPAWLRRIRAQIQDEPSEVLSAASLAAESGYHPVYVARTFRQFYGIGLGEYGRLVRAEYALRLLGAQDEPLSQVALRAGYADQSHLTRSMRRFTGLTPAKIRKLGGQIIKVASVQECCQRSRLTRGRAL